MPVSPDAAVLNDLQRIFTKEPKAATGDDAAAADDEAGDDDAGGAAATEAQKATKLKKQISGLEALIQDAKDIQAAIPAKEKKLAELKGRSSERQLMYAVLFR